jgi:hypothetical protein
VRKLKVSGATRKSPRLQSGPWFSSVAILDVPSVLLKHLHGRSSRPLKFPHCS